MNTEISSPKNPLLKAARELARERKARREQGLTLVEGVRLVEEVVAAGAGFAWCLYTAELTAKERGARLLAALRTAGAQPVLCPEELLARAADTEQPQGILAAVAVPRYGLADLGDGPVLVADGIGDPGNLGTMLRTALALGSGGVVVSGGADPWAPKTVRAAMGAGWRLPVVEAGSEAFAALAPARRLLLMEAAAGEPAWQAPLTGPLALVVGSEAVGPSPAARAAAQGAVHVPMPGRAESLNAAQAAAMLLYEALRQRNLQS